MGELLLLGALFLVSKIAIGRSSVKLDDNPTVFMEALHELTYMSQGDDLNPQNTSF